MIQDEGYAEELAIGLVGILKGCLPIAIIVLVVGAALVFAAIWSSR